MENDGLIGGISLAMLVLLITLFEQRMSLRNAAFKFYWRISEIFFPLKLQGFDKKLHLVLIWSSIAAVFCCVALNVMGDVWWAEHSYMLFGIFFLIAIVLPFKDTANQQGGFMAENEKTSKTIAKIASKGLKDPGSLSNAEIKKLAATALTQTADKLKKLKKTVK